MTIETVNGYWECACQAAFIHAKEDATKCRVCNTNECDMPDARQEDFKSENMAVTEKQVDEAKALLKRAGFIVNLFHKNDIRESCDEAALLTETEIDDIAERLEDVGADDGINWGTIHIFVDAVLEERKEQD